MSPKLTLPGLAVVVLLLVFAAMTMTANAAHTRGDDVRAGASEQMGR